MNIRQILHTIAVVASAIAVGSISLDFLPTETLQIVVAVAGFIAMVINTYMGFTTQGSARSN